ncbi:Na+/H+ antiporter NhaC [Desulfovibrio sp. OttesenSCG-928-C14]|nr:Na+/H+ antiporter NhaC [Desulfovibrio sp. OttesenSCG-928-C14]
MEEFKDNADPRKPSLPWALLCFLLPIAVILYGTVIISLRPPVLPLIVAVALAGLLCLKQGYRWSELQDGMFTALARVQIAVAILVMVGMIISSWIACGTIPLLIYWGLKLITPEYFLLSCLILCSVASVATGTSVSTMGTVGVALLGMGSAMGYPVHITAGAVISGAYFGDKMSPISDTTNIAASVCEVPLFQHIGSMMWTTVPAFLVCAGLYTYMGANQPLEAASAATGIEAILSGLEANYSLHWAGFIPPALMLLLAFMRFPVLPVLLVCLVSAVILCFFEGLGLLQIGALLTGGFKSATGVKAIDSLLSRGGVMSVMATVLLMSSGVAFGGILEKARVFDVLIEALLKNVKKAGGLIASAVATGFLINLGTGSQVLAVIVPGRAFNKAFKKADIHGAVLSRSCEDTGTITCPLVPWSVHAFIIMGILGVSAWDYAFYSFLNWIVPIFSILLAFLKIGVWHRDGRPYNLGLRITPERAVTEEK